MSAFLLGTAVVLAIPHLPDPDCRLLVKGDGFAVHAVRSAWRAPVAKADPPRERRDGWFHAVTMPQGTWAFTHTDLKTGRMTKLFEGGAWAYQSPPMGVDKAGGFSAEVVGWAADESHLYLLMRSEFRLGFADRGDKGADFTLIAYRLMDGRQSARHPVKGVEEKRKPFEPLVRGEFPKLPLTKDGLKIGTTDFWYKGGTLLPR